MNYTEHEYHIEGQKFWCRDGTNDEDVVRSCRSEYALPNLDGYEPGSFILDIGGHIGAFSIWAAQKYHDSRVIAVEPIPENQIQFMKNVEANNLQHRITLIRAAAWSTKEPTLIIPYGDLGTESGRIHHFVGNASAVPSGVKQTVARTIGLNEIMSGVPKVWCMKVDCENGEYPLFEEDKEGEEDVFRIKWIIGEYHNGPERLRACFDPEYFVEHPHPAGSLGHFCYENRMAFRFV